jgi:hypothetical protein
MDTMQAGRGGDWGHDSARMAALEIMLLLADADARWGDYRSAVSLLDTAAQVAGELPDEYAVKRARWARLRSVAA